MAKEDIFRRKTAVEIIRDKKLIKSASGLETLIRDIKDDEALVITSELPGMANAKHTRDEEARRFMKHGPEVKIKRFYSKTELLRYICCGESLHELRRDAFTYVPPGDHCSYSFVPVMGRDKRKRKVPLTECLNAAKLYWYAKNMAGGFEIKPYDDADAVADVGADIVVSVPSRTPKKERYKVKLISVPVVDSIMKYPIAFSISAMHECMSPLYKIAYNEKTDERPVYFDAHVIAAYFAVVRHYHEKGNRIPWEMCQFAVPSQFMVNLYRKMLDNCVILDKDAKGKEKYYPLNIAQLEALVHRCVKKFGYANTFRPTRRLQDYEWMP